MGDSYSGSSLPIVQTNWNCQQVTPKVLKLKKTYDGPEDETATGPNFPHNYTITADIANQQVLNDLTLNDTLPPGMVMTGAPIVTVHGAVATAVASCPSTNTNNPYVYTPGFDIRFCNSITGTLSADDVKVVYGFYVGDVTVNCVPKVLTNIVNGKAHWQPLDPRDAPMTVYAIPAGHKLTAKCLAVQKTVTPNGTKPGGLLNYTVNFQVSDYKRIGQIGVTDFLSDGQQYMPGSAGLWVRDRTGAFSARPFNPTKLTTVPSTSFSCTGAISNNYPTQPTVYGGTLMTFNVSGLMSPSPSPTINAGILVGGWSWTPTATTPATGVIRFQARVTDTYNNPTQFPVSSTHKFVDKHDPINNCVRIKGVVYSNGPALTSPQVVATPFQAPTDTSGTSVRVPSGSFTKTVYAVRRADNTFRCGPGASIPTCTGGTPPDVHPGDRVSYQLTYNNIPSGDTENFTVQDWVPIPAFAPAAPTYSTASSCLTALAANTVCTLPSHSIGVTPVVSFVAPNSMKLNYGTFNNTLNSPRQLDVVYTVATTGTPFADSLRLTNDAQQCEGNSFNETFCTRAIAQINMREPSLTITKGVVASSNPHSHFTVGATHTITAPGIFKIVADLPANWIQAPPLNPCTRFNGTINHVNSVGLFNSNLQYADASDLVSFAIVVENKGGHPAYNVNLSEVLPSTFIPVLPPCVATGGGVNVPWTGTLPNIFLSNPIPELNPATAIDGSNIVIIMIDGTLDKLAFPGCSNNEASIKRYTALPDWDFDPSHNGTLRVNPNRAASAGVAPAELTGSVIGVPIDIFPHYTAPNFVGAPGLPATVSDTAQVCVGPKALGKCIVSTSNPLTTPDNAPMGGSVNGVFGEVIRYRLMMSIPEGNTLPINVTDNLPAGMVYVAGSAKYFIIANNTPAWVPAGKLVNGDEGLLYDSVNGNSIMTCSQPLTKYMYYALNSGPALTGSGNVNFTLPISQPNFENDGNLEVAVVEFEAKIASDYPQVFVNNFTVKVGDEKGTQSDTSGTVSVNTQLCDLKITKTWESGLGSFILKIQNVGTSSCTGTTTVTDPFPVGVTTPGVGWITSTPASVWGCSSSTTTSTNIACTTNTSLPPGWSGSITIPVKVQSGVSSNTAYVSNPNDWNPANNQSTYVFP